MAWNDIKKAAAGLKDTVVNTVKDAITDKVEAFRKEKGYWAEYPGCPAADWQAEVANGDTREGYWDWVENKLEDE